MYENDIFHVSIDNSRTYGSLEGPFKIPTFRVPRTQYLDNWWQKDVFPTLNSNIVWKWRFAESHASTILEKKVGTVCPIWFKEAPPFPPMQCWSVSCCQRPRQVAQHWLMGVGKDMTNGELGGFFKTMHCPKCPYNREHWDDCNKVDQVSQLFLSRIVGISTICFNTTTCWLVVNSTSQHLVWKWGHVKLQATRHLNILLQNDDILRCRQLGMSIFCIKMTTCGVEDNSVRSTFCSKMMAWWFAGNKKNKQTKQNKTKPSDGSTSTQTGKTILQNW